MRSRSLRVSDQHHLLEVAPPPHDELIFGGLEKRYLLVDRFGIRLTCLVPRIKTRQSLPPW